MDVGKVLSVISDLDNENDRLDIDDVLQQFINNLTSSNTAGIEAEEEALLNIFQTSVVNTYVPSNLEILQFVGGDEFFGLRAYYAIRDILYDTPYKVQDSIERLNDYAKSRKTFTALLNKTRANLEGLNFESKFPENDNYQVGLLFPEKVTDNKINNITKELNHWDKLIKTFRELTGGSPEDTQISAVSTGSLDFFIDNGPATGILIATALSKIADLYKKIIEIRAAKKKLKDLGIPAAEQKTIDKQEKDFINSGLDEISKEIVKEFAVKNIESGRFNELKVSVNGHIRYMAKCVGSGIVIEVNPPEIHDDSEEDAEKEPKGGEKRDSERRQKQIEVVQKSMEAVKSLGNIGSDVVKLLGNGDIEDEGKE